MSADLANDSSRQIAQLRPRVRELANTARWLSPHGYVTAVV